MEFAFPPVSEERTVPEASGKTSGETSGRIVALMRQEPDVTIPEIAVALHKTPRAIEMQLARLKSDQPIRRIGPAKGGHWEVAEE